VIHRIVVRYDSYALTMVVCLFSFQIEKMDKESNSAVCDANQSSDLHTHSTHMSPANTGILVTCLLVRYDGFRFSGTKTFWRPAIRIGISQ
jgi:hypothetical protein